MDTVSRYMDDIIILVKTKRQLTKARKKIFNILRELKLEISPHKTRMGQLKEGFHFLGVDFAISQNQQSKIQVNTKLHSRSCRRALDKVEFKMQSGLPNSPTRAREKTPVVCADNKVRFVSEPPCLRNYAVNPAPILHYLIHWATWWHRMIDVDTMKLIEDWIDFVEKKRPWFNWTGSGLISLKVQ